jgi:iron complex outermembrane recepter protein
VLFDRKLRLNIAAFREKFKNFQAQSFTKDGVSILGNAEGVLSQGVELDATLKPVRRFTINYNATLLDSHFTKYSTDPCYTGQSLASCPTGVFFEGAGIDTPTSAHYTGTLEGIYEMPIGPSSHLALSANWYHRSSVNFSTSASPFTQLGAIDVFGANLSFRSDKGYEVAIFCKNCSNRIYPNFIATYPGDAALGAVSSYDRFGYNSVRTIGASVTYHF